MCGDDGMVSLKSYIYIVLYFNMFLHGHICNIYKTYRLGDHPTCKYRQEIYIQLLKMPSIYFIDKLNVVLISVDIMLIN